MKRRDSIKTLIVTSLASGLVLEGCLPKEKEIIYENIWKYQYGRTAEEKKRDSELLNKTFFTKDEMEKINKIAVCGGSGSFLVNDAIRKGADVFITSDFKYHDFFEANNKIILVDIGHYESEQFTKDLIFEFLNKNLINIALHLTDENTNPIKYFK